MPFSAPSKRKIAEILTLHTDHSFGGESERRCATDNTPRVIGTAGAVTACLSYCEGAGHGNKGEKHNALYLPSIANSVAGSSLTDRHEHHGIRLGHRRIANIGRSRSILVTERAGCQKPDDGTHLPNRGNQGRARYPLSPGYESTR